MKTILILTAGLILAGCGSMENEDSSLMSSTILVDVNEDSFTTG